MESIKSQLIDMGFAEAKVQRAMSACPDATTLEQIMEWLIAHDEELVNMVSEPPPSSSLHKTDHQNKTGQEAGATSAAIQSSPIRPEKSDDQSVGPVPAENGEAIEMAQKKSITIAEAERIIEERRKIRELEDRKKAIEDEKNRRMHGQKMAETRAELEAAERIRVAQQIRKERTEKELYHKQIMEQIARDREVRRALDGKNEAQTEPGAAVKRQDATISKPCPASGSSSRSYTECKIALRLPDGSSLTHTFSAQEQLASVRLFIIMKFEDYASKEIVFSIPPKTKFTEKDMEETLEKLGLCPSARLTVTLR